jgi:KAP-like P-loop domain-containing protein
MAGVARSPFGNLHRTNLLLSSSRRERFWFSGGSWLDQGQSSAAAAITWTHWLTDRQLRVPGAVFDQAYAFGLYDQARLVAKQPKDSSGTFPWAVAAVLQQRGIVADAYHCEDNATFVPAVLEHGPVVVGLVWRAGMDAPEQIDGHAVCRPGGAIRGSHAVLVNGISLDLELGGRKGFARLKNSWGRSWGNGGQALISLEDLWEQFAKSGAEALLAFPSLRYLPEGVTRDDLSVYPGPAVQPSAPAVERYRREAISSDIWTTRDRLGSTAYAEAIARGIRHRLTSPPLTIGIKAPWGAGKTSLMRMIRDRLEWPAGIPAGCHSGEFREIHLTSSSVRALTSPARRSLHAVTNGTVLRQLRSRDGEPSRQLTADPDPAGGDVPDLDEQRWLPTVWFNPWTYQTGQQVWAGLAQEIIAQTTRRMRRAEREHFWLRLNLRRVDEHTVRRHIYALIFGRILPITIAAGFLTVVGLVLLAAGLPRWTGLILAAGSPAALAVLLAGQAWAVLRSGVSGMLASLVRPAFRLRGFAGTQGKDASAGLVRSPDYAKEGGYLAAWRQDLSEVLNLVATPDRPLVVFIDDLDRCSPGTVVEVIEAINAFLAGEFANAIFVVAMEPRMVAAHIETAYQDLVAKVKDATGYEDAGAGLGWRFLEKFIQLPLTLPAMVPDQSADLLHSLFPAEAGPLPPARQEFPAAEALRPPESLAQAVQLADSPAVTHGPAAKEAVRDYVDRQLSVDTPGLQAIIDYSSRMLAPNPRELKRFANLFRFFVMITTERRLLGLPTPESLDALAKLAVLAIRWPALVPVLAGTTAAGHTVLELLEDRISTTATENNDELPQVLAAAGLTDSTVRQLLSPGLRGFLGTEPKISPHTRGYL